MAGRSASRTACWEARGARPFKASTRADAAAETDIWARNWKASTRSRTHVLALAVSFSAARVNFDPFERGLRAEVFRCRRVPRPSSSPPWSSQAALYCPGAVVAAVRRLSGSVRLLPAACSGLLVSKRTSSMGEPQSLISSFHAACNERKKERKIEKEVASRHVLWPPCVQLSRSRS